MTTPEATVAHLRTLTTPAEANAHLERFTKSELIAVAGALGLDRLGGRTNADITELIVRLTVTGRTGRAVLRDGASWSGRGSRS